MPADGITNLRWGEAGGEPPGLNPPRFLHRVDQPFPLGQTRTDCEPGRIVRITGFGGGFAEAGAGAPGGRKRGSSRHWALSGELVNRIVAEWTVSSLPHKRRGALAVLAGKIQRSNGP